MTVRPDVALEAMGDAVLAVAGERSVDGVLQRLVEVARTLADARYAALGVPDGEGKFARFITTGMSDELVAAMGPLPRTHGLLGAMLEVRESFRTPDVREDPRFRGWWPSAHPRMASFLGVPIASDSEILGAFYLTDKEGAEHFTPDDQRLIELLAAHAAIAIETARLYERSRELSAIEERTRLARDLHDSVVQKLFGVVLAARSATALLDSSGAEARAELVRCGDLAEDAVAELRSLMFSLRPATIGSDGLAAALGAHLEVLRRVHPLEIVFRAEATTRLLPDAEEEVFKIAQEAVRNALRHADARRLEVILAGERGDGGMSLWVRDDGVGFDPLAPAPRSRTLGLTAMEERAAALGGVLTLESAPGRGTTVTLEVPS